MIYSWRRTHTNGYGLYIIPFCDLEIGLARNGLQRSNNKIELFAMSLCVYMCFSVVLFLYHARCLLLSVLLILAWYNVYLKIYFSVFEWMEKDTEKKITKSILNLLEYIYISRDIYFVLRVQWNINISVKCDRMYILHINVFYYVSV